MAQSIQQQKQKQKPQLSLAHKLDLLTGVFALISAGIAAVFTGLWRSERDAPTYYLHIAYAVMRKSTERYSAEQLQWALPTTDQVYEQYARSARLKPQTIELGNGAKGHWVGDKNAKNVLIWYHGGGFAMSANLAHFEFLDNLIIASRASSKELAVFALTYTLSSDAQYPTQLTQAVEALRYILSQKTHRPGSILLGGDSAGASLAMGVLSHLAHPHPAITPVKLSKPLAGAILLALPPSTDENIANDVEVYYGGDIIVPHVALQWLSKYLDNQKPDFYTDPLDAPPGWFETLPVKKILASAGGNEILRPIIEEFVQKVQPVIPSIELFIGKREAHVAPVYNLFVGDKTETEQGRKIKTWLKDVL
ncbi:hypothetical protein QQS21_011337 [Conoideocrella luteorostrata]|uniref:Alpha/beta hydrolase fold-3 domain-containing protein n=1 Tax=Conoideocrella luteorostrata TaxID=1105319 RepID=A0AAJ0CDA5_9HYPO|nr:hypothetical protein QQS21_011337 [Conoideocrella luteorostrata]